MLTRKLKIGLAILLLIVTGACSSSSISLPPDVTTTGEGLAVFCALYRNIELIDHDTGNSERNERSWSQHLGLARNLISLAPRQVEGAVWDYLHILEVKALQIEQLGWIDFSAVPIAAQRNLNAQLQPLINGVASLTKFTNEQC